MAMVLDMLQVQDIVAHHLPGKLNIEADYLSRPDKGGEIPAKLVDLNVRQLNEAWMLECLLPPPGIEPGLWGKSQAVSSVFESM